MTVTCSQDFVTIVRCKDMIAFVTYCLYLKQFCKMQYNMTTVSVKYTFAVNQKLFQFKNSVNNYHFLTISRVTASFASHV